ncbi:MAG: hypothetical protein Q9M31_03520 [Mariprofundus sp.]|nr:hypothetical protein [Mariprofundus sp.]
MRHLNRYLGQLATAPLIDEPAEAKLGLITVIPCMHEPAMVELLDHLRSCQMSTTSDIEIIIVLNHPASAAELICKQNRDTLEQIKRWQVQHNQSGFKVHLITAFDLPAKASGVGIARKIGMDEAMARFVSVGKEDGIIASLDADCLVSSNYFTHLLQAFSQQPKMHAATIAYQHRIDEEADTYHRLAITYYELFLRYIEMGWSYAGLPYAFTAIGSCFAVRANTAARHQGMNKRQAGEDFYFLHKLARERPLAHIAGVTVYPSARISSRTPFGTGQAISDWYHNDHTSWPVCAPELFIELKKMHETLDQLFSTDTDSWLANLSPSLRQYLQTAKIEQAAASMRNNSSSAINFKKSFYFWFDGLKAWRYANQQQTIPIEEALVTLLQLKGTPSLSNDAKELLKQLRAAERIKYPRAGL